MSNEDKLKFVILGQAHVGNTSLLLRYFSNKFNENEKSTLNPSCYEKTENYNGINFDLVFWDTLGQEKFNSLNAIYYQNALGALIVYDLTTPETLERVKTWVNTLKEILGENINYVVVGNKIDLIGKDKKDIIESEIEEFRQEEGFEHFFTSAKSGFNVKEAFDSLIETVLKNVDKNKIVSKKRKVRKLEITAPEVKPLQKKKCC